MIETRLEWAKNYISYGIRKGFIQEEYDFDEMDAAEIIKIATELSDRADYYYERSKEEDKT